MKRIALFILPLFARATAEAQIRPSDKQSQIQFKIKNFGFSVEGSFGGLAGTILFDPTHLEQAAFDVTVDAGTVNTDNGMRDGHLRAESYFDAVKYPKIRLVSDKVMTADRAGSFVMSGKLTIKDKTRPVLIPFTAAPTADGGWVFKGGFSINRRDFGVGGASTISDRLDVTLKVLAK